jgi:hypothetical protein
MVEVIEIEVSSGLDKETLMLMLNAGDGKSLLRLAWVDAFSRQGMRAEVSGCKATALEFSNTNPISVHVQYYYCFTGYYGCKHHVCIGHQDDEFNAIYKDGKLLVRVQIDHSTADEH